MQIVHNEQYFTALPYTQSTFQLPQNKIKYNIGIFSEKRKWGQGTGGKGQACLAGKAGDKKNKKKQVCRREMYIVDSLGRMGCHFIKNLSSFQFAGLLMM
jgi:hypothetical protein